jgi:hypothetical protein
MHSSTVQRPRDRRPLVPNRPPEAPNAVPRRRGAVTCLARTARVRMTPSRITRHQDAERCEVEVRQ